MSRRILPLLLLLGLGSPAWAQYRIQSPADVKPTLTGTIVGDWTIQSPTDANSSAALAVKQYDGTSVFNVATTTGRVTLYDLTISHLTAGLLSTDGSGNVTAGSANLDDLGDVDTSAVADGKVLKYNALSGNWEAGTDITGGGGSASWGSITGTLSDQTDLNNALNSKAPTSHAANAATYGYGDTTNAGHLRVGTGLAVSGGTVSNDDKGSTAVSGHEGSYTHTDIALNTAKRHDQVHDIDGADHTGTLSWSKVSKTGSSLADLATRVTTNLTDWAAGATNGQLVKWVSGTGKWTPFTPNYEPGLGNPVSDGYLLTSTAAGVRSWSAGTAHAAVTVSDSTSVDLTLTGQALSAVVLPAGVDHGSLGGLADDDHTQYHTDARALTWLGTRSTTDLPEGSRLYYTDARARAALSASAPLTYNSSTGAFGVTTGTTAGTVATGNHNHAGTYVPVARTLTAGSGLTGGGDLSADRTFAVSWGGSGAATTASRSDHYHSSLNASDGSPTDALLVDATGNVGIGTTAALGGYTPTLSLAGSQVSTSASQIELRGYRAAADAGLLGRLSWHNALSTGTEKRVAQIDAYAGGDVEAGNLRFLTANAAGTVQETLRIANLTADVYGLLRVSGSMTAAASVYGAYLTPTLTPTEGGLGAGVSVVQTVGSAATNIADAIGLYVPAGTWTKGTSGTVSRAYGLYVTPPTLATSNYAIYVSSGTSAFGGSVGFGGITAPSESIHTGTNLRVDGTLKLPALSNGILKVASGAVASGGAASDLSGWPAAVSMTEVGYLDGVTSALQTQLDGKSATSHVHSSLAASDGSPATVLSVDATGKVGIGTDAATYTLDVDTGSNGAVRIADNASATLRLESQTATTGRTWLLQSVGSTGNYRLYDAGVGGGGTGTGEVLTVTSKGNVGINTTTPTAAKLAVAAAGASQPGLNVSANNTTEANTGLFLSSSGAGYGRIETGAYYNGANWVATHTSAYGMHSQLGTWVWTADLGLTAGNTFTPTNRMTLSTDGLLTVANARLTGQTAPGFVKNDTDGDLSGGNTIAIGDVTNLQTTLDGKAASSHTHSLSNISDWPSAVSTTELGYLDGVTSNIQNQLDGKAYTIHDHKQFSEIEVTGSDLATNALTVRSYAPLGANTGALIVNGGNVYGAQIWSQSQFALWAESYSSTGIIAGSETGTGIAVSSYSGTGMYCHSDLGDHVNFGSGKLVLSNAGNLTVTGSIRSNAGFNFNGTAGVTTTITIPKLTTGGSNGSLNITGGIITAATNPT